MCHRLQYPAFTIIAALLCTPSFVQLGQSQTFERLPRLNSVAQLERLPSTDEGPSVTGPQLEPHRGIRFAGGGIELQVPDGWWAQEVPFGREIRLVVASQRPANLRKMPADAMWMAYHATAASESRDAETLSRELSERLRMVVGSNAKFSPPTPFQFGRWNAAVAEFTARDPSLANAPITGRHVLVRTDWGIFEFHASAPDAIVEARSDTWTRTWDSLLLNPPATASESAQNEVRDSGTILGDWKSYRSRMRFSGDGRVAIVPDALGDNRQVKPVTGTFESRDDLVFVRWDDGSRLNFRFRLQGNDLFLTDHEGQISHLKRVLN